MHSLNDASPQNIFGFAGDEFTFNKRNKIIKMTANIARNVVDIFNRFHCPTTHLISLPFSNKTQFSLMQHRSPTTLRRFSDSWILKCQHFDNSERHKNENFQNIIKVNELMSLDGESLI